MKLIEDLATLASIEQAFASGNQGAVESLFIQPGERNPHTPLARSALMVSAARAAHLNRLPALTADVAIINLEDGVSPQQKPMARLLAAAMVSRVDKRHARMVVRINPIGAGGEADIALINRALPDAIRIPKIRSIEQLDQALELIDPRIEIELSIETREAFAHMNTMRRSDRITAYYLGIMDLLVDLGLPQSLIQPGNPTVEAIMVRMLLESRIAGVRPFSFVFQQYRDEDTFRHWCRRAREMGYSGSGCISPGQVAIANELFAPSPIELERACYIIDRFELMRSTGVTGFADERYGFIDEPVYRDAIALRDAAAMIGGNDTIDRQV